MSLATAEKMDYAQPQEITLDYATERLSHAFDRLEGLVFARLHNQPAEAASAVEYEDQQQLLAAWAEQYDALERNFETLRQDNETLAKLLDDSRQEVSLMQEVVQTVTHRLELSIHSIDQIIEL